MNEYTISESEYFKLTRACDDLISRSDAPDDIVALPWLHVINEVPFILSAYSDVFHTLECGKPNLPPPNPFVSVRNFRRHNIFHFGQFLKCFIRSFYFSDSRMIEEPFHRKSLLANLELTGIDVLIVTWLVNRKHLSGKTDFYFGELQQLLKKRGLSSLLLMRNQSGYHSQEIQQEVLVKGQNARLLLPDTQPPQEEWHYMKRMLGLRRYLRKIRMEKCTEIEKRLLRKTAEFSVIAPGLDNLRLHDQIEMICRKLSPSIVITLYEGHAWERCVWYAARKVSPKILCVGYQHTILRKNSHAIKRSLFPDLKECDPDLVLTVGEVTKQMLEHSQRLGNVEMLNYGTHRRYGSRIDSREPKTASAILVLPEGVESESIYLFDLALACAIHLPNVRFIFRMHPVLPFEKVAPLLTGYPPKTGNIEVSDRTNIEEDFERTGYVLYRGSSTVMYAIIAGLKPYYLKRENEINFDPIFELTVWRENIRSSEELIQRYRKDRNTANDHRKIEWQEALDYCDQYTQPVREDALDQMIERASMN